MKIKLLLWLAMMLGSPVLSQVLPNDAILNGKTIGDWSAEWWKWVSPIRLEESPLFDPDGSFANLGQAGSVFFLAGIINTSGTVKRHFDVPEDHFLFFPLQNFSADNIDTDPPLSVSDLRNLLAGAMDLITEVHMSIDGVMVADLLSHRAISSVFSISYSDPDNLESFQAGHPFIGLDDPIVSDGYWLMVEPLPAGAHVINFGGTIGPPFNLTLDITDIITVVPIPLSRRVQQLSALVLAANLAPNRVQPLLASLDAANASFACENAGAGTNQLRAFQNKVRAQIARSDAALADQLSSAAQKIIDKARTQSGGQ